MPTLKDEQKQAINHNEGSILVSASAGSGKTFVMINRLIRLVSEGKASLNQILALTFTEAAADEMKEKLKSALRKRVEEGNYSLAKVIEEVSTADISTFHGFCGRLIRKYFFVVGLSPDFSIADEKQALIIKKQSLDKTFKMFYASKEKWFRSLVDKLAVNRSDEGLRQLVLQAFEFFSADANPQESLLYVLNRYQYENFENLLSEYKAYLNLRLERLKSQAETVKDGVSAYSNKPAESFCQGLIDDIDTLINGDLYLVKEYENYARRLDFGKKISAEEETYKTNAKAIRKSIVDIAKEFSNHLTEKERDKDCQRTLESDSKDFCKVMLEFMKIYQADKLEENVLDFADLEHFALEILQDEQVRQTVKNQYKYIFIDEYQDVNGVQEELMNKIVNDNIFMVGDVKQSIYGFRGCRADFFSNKLEQMPKNGQKTLQLDYNFRSANAVIEMVNKIFCYSMTKDRFGADYTKSMLLSGGVYPDYAEGRTSLHSIVMPKRAKGEGEKSRVYNILDEIKNPKTKDASPVSSLVASIINEELGKKYYDTKEEKEKTVSYGDVCILTRNRENAYVSNLVQGLIRHGIPVVSEVSQNICYYPEVQVLINVLRLIDCFNGDIPLASTLKSAIGKFTDEDLAEIVLYYTDNFDYSSSQEKMGGFYQAYEFYLNNAQTPLREKLSVFDQYFKNLRFLADFIGACGVLEKVIADSGYFAEILCERFGDFKVKRIKKLIAESLSNGKRLSVREFLSLIDNNEKAFGLSEVAEEDTVKVMTMHASKGLEFPVVIVCGLERKMRLEDDEDVCFFDRNYGFALKLFNTEKRTAEETLLRGIIKEKTREEGVKEEMRLFYVATTRATYSLHLTVQGEIKSNPDVFYDATCFEDCLPSTLEVTTHNLEDLRQTQVSNEVKTVLLGSPDQKIVDRISKNFAFNYPFLQDITLPLKSSVTKELVENQEQNSLEHYLFDGEDTTDIERGLIAHKLMECFDFNGVQNVKLQAQALVKEGVLTQEQIEKINLERIQAVLDSGALSHLRNESVFREKSFVASVNASLIKDVESQEKIVIQGVIDLLSVTKDGAEIIDYKYSSLTPESLSLKYAKQLSVYAEALTVSTGIKVKNTTIVNLYTGDVVAIN